MTTPVRPYLEADVKCFHCGHISSVARVERGSQNPKTTFKPVDSSAEILMRNRSQLKCLRCGGPTFTDEFELRQEYAQVDFLEDRPRRGRPPKRLVERRLAEQQRGVA